MDLVEFVDPVLLSDTLELVVGLHMVLVEIHNVFGCLKPVLDWHLDVQEDHIVESVILLFLADEVKSLLTVEGLVN